MKRKRPNNLFNDFDNLFNSLFSGFSPLDYFGEDMGQKGSNEDGEWVTETIKLDNGMVVHKAYYTSNSQNKNVSELDLLKSKRDKAIEVEDFELAAELRDKIKSLEKNKLKLDELNAKLNEAIKSQDFETAIVLRDEIKNMK